MLNTITKQPKTEEETLVELLLENISSDYMKKESQEVVDYLMSQYLDDQNGSK